MNTIIAIKKNKPAFDTLISLAKELEKKDDSISVYEFNDTESDSEVLPPKSSRKDLIPLFNNLKNFPTLRKVRKKAWPKISS